MSVRRITAAAALLGAGLVAQANAAETTVKATAAKPVAITPAPAAPAPAAATPSGPVGKVEIKETIFDAGTVERGTDISHSFTLKNIGEGDLTVEAKPG